MVRTMRFMAVTAAMAALVSTAAMSATKTTRYEAEAPGNTLVGCIARSDGSWYSGTGFVGDLGDNTVDKLIFNNVIAGVTGDYSVLVSYKTWGTRPLDLVVNGGPKVRINCIEIANNLGNVTKTVSLNAGSSNTIELWSSGSAWGPDVDYIDITGEAGVVPEPSSLAALAGLMAPAAMLLRRKRA